MSNACLRRTALGPMFVLAAALTASAQNDANLLRRVSINVNAVSPRQVLEMIARTVDCSLALDPKVSDLVTIQVSRVTARTALNALCESVGCRWRVDGQTLRVDSEPATALSPDVSDKGAKPRLSDPLPLRRARLPWLATA